MGSNPGDIKPCLPTWGVETGNMSRYPSAYGHTPSYRSYTSSTSSGLPSYLASPAVSRREYYDLGSSRGRSSSLLRDEFRKEFAPSAKSLIDDALYSDLENGFSSFSRKVRERSMFDSDFDHEFSLLKSVIPTYEDQSNSRHSKTNHSSIGGGVPHKETHSETTYKSVKTGPSGIPQTSYHHSQDHYDSHNPYKNRHTTYSYNI